MGRCESCPFGTPAIDNPDEIRPAKLLIIGEAPGRNEVREGKPFVGKSGNLLWKSLNHFGIDRSEVAITNALSCFVPEAVYNKKASALKAPVTCCGSRLHREIEQVRPELILTLGNTALWAVYQDFSFKITKERGRIRPYYLRDGTMVKVLPTMHPAAILRSPSDFGKFRSDIAYLSHVYATDEVREPGWTEWTHVTEETVADVIEFLKPYTYLGADIETAKRRDEDGNVVEGNSFDPLQSRIYAVGVSYEKNKVFIFDESAIPHLGPLFSNPDHRFIWHNGKFDTKFLRVHGLPARLDEDTILLHYCLDEMKGTHDLSQLSTLFLGADDYATKFKATLADKSDFSSGPWEALCDYLGRDCDYTLQLFDIFSPQVRENPHLLKEYTELLLPLSEFLQSVENDGIWVNPEEIEHLATTLAEQSEKLNEDIAGYAKDYWDPVDYMVDTGVKSPKMEFNPGSWQQLQWILYESMGLRPTNGERNTEEETLRSIPPHPFVDLILERRKLEKQLKTYVYGVRDKISVDGRVHSTFKIIGTVTGRLSSADPNLQNIPKRAKHIRNIFQAQGSNIFVECDLAQAELRTLAGFSTDDTLTQVFLDGRDLHTETAKAIARLIGEKSDEEIELISGDAPERRGAKAVNFGICYGLTAFSLMERLGVSLMDANLMLQAWKENYPVAWEWLQEQRKLPLKGGYLITPFGRHRRYTLVTKENVNAIQNEASNFKIQSTASDINLLMTMNAAPEIRKIGGRIINLVHDSNLTEIAPSPGIGAEVVRIYQESLDYVTSDILGWQVPFALSAEVGAAWGSLDDEDPLLVPVGKAA